MGVAATDATFARFDVSRTVRVEVGFTPTRVPITSHRAHATQPLTDRRARAALQRSDRYQ